jgi:hypothetical protein
MTLPHGRRGLNVGSAPATGCSESVEATVEYLSGGVAADRAVPVDLEHLTIRSKPSVDVARIRFVHGRWAVLDHFK